MALRVRTAAVRRATRMMALLLARRYGVARITSSVAVATIMIGWAVGQYPYLLLPYLTIEEAAGSRSTLVAMTVVLLVGSLFLAPALIYMYVLFSRPEHPPGPDHADDPRLRAVGGSVTSR